MFAPDFHARLWYIEVKELQEEETRRQERQEDRGLQAPKFKAGKALKDAIN